MSTKSPPGGAPTGHASCRRPRAWQRGRGSRNQDGGIKRAWLRSFAKKGEPTDRQVYLTPEPPPASGGLWLARQSTAGRAARLFWRLKWLTNRASQERPHASSDR